MGQDATTLNMVAPPHAESIPRVGFPEEISQDELFTSATLQMDARATFTATFTGHFSSEIWHQNVQRCARSIGLITGLTS